MSIISETVRNIIILVLIFSCLELFLPQGELSRFARLGFAVILLAMIIIPAANSINQLPAQWQPLYEANQVNADYKDTAQRIQLILQKEAMSSYEADAALNMAAAACLADGISSAEATVKAAENGSILRAEIIAVKKADISDEAAAEAIRKTLHDFYLLQEENVFIQICEE